MDHDDTDFQSQSFHLAGEENSKFPSGLRPFALPKVDIEEQLQGHLRFDNLIDSEVFFSIQGHSSNWIEVLSTGSSVADFSSSAAESCSISKTNNVWSEATSMESVEMLLKSVGENEMAGNMDGNAHSQLISGMDSQIDPSNMQPESSNPPTGSSVVPTENDQLQNTLPRMTDSPSRAKPQLEQVAGSVLSDRKSDLVLDSVAEKCVVNEKLSSTSNNTSESCPAAGNYFGTVHNGHSLDKLNVPSSEIDSGKLNSEPFPELSPLQNIYVTDSYHFEQDNQGSDVGITPHDPKVRHIDEHKVHGGLHELHNLPCTSQPLSAVNLSSQVGNETILSESSDGLLEAITNPVTMLHRNDDRSKRVSGTVQPSLSPMQQAAEGMKSSGDRSNKLVVKEFNIGEESSSALSHQTEPDSRNSSPHVGTSVSAESSKLAQSPEAKHAQATSVPVETNSAEVGSKSIGVLEHQDSADKLKGGAGEEISAVSANVEQMMGSGHEENTTGATGTSKHKFDSSEGTAPGNYSDGSVDGKESNISSVNHEESLKEGDTPAFEEETENQHSVSPASVPREIISAPLISSSNNIVSTTVTGSVVTSEDKDNFSGDPDDSSAAFHDVKDLRMTAINHEGSAKEDSKSTLEDGGCTIIPPGSEPRGELSAVLVDSNIDAVCSGTNAAAAEKGEYTEHATFGGLITGETKDNSGNHRDAYSQAFQTDIPSIQSEHQKDLVTPTTSGMSSDKADQKTVDAPLNARDDLNSQVQDAVLDHGSDRTAGSVSSQGKLASFMLKPENDDGRCPDATCGSPTVISCTEPSPQEGGRDSNASLHQTVDEQSEAQKGPEASAVATQSSKECSTRNAKPTLSSEEPNTAGDDRSFSFEVGAPPNLSEKAHSPAWNPFPRYDAAQSTEVTTKNPQPESPSGSSLKKTCDDSNKMSVVEAGKEQLSERKVTGGARRPSVNAHIGDSTKTMNSPPERSQPHLTPEGSDSVNLPFTDPQHVQLRAQIFVYGALIQGIPPLEVYMAAAFGEPGGGKPTWQAAWHAAYERIQTQKPIFTGLDTPTGSHIGSCVSEKASKGTSVKTVLASKKGGKSVLPAHSAVPLQSPTFNVPRGSSPFNLQRGTHLDFSQAASPVFAYNSQMRQPTSGTASWYPPSPGPRPAPWLVPPQNLIFDSSMQAAVPTNETAKGASSKNMSISHSVSPGAFLPVQTSSIVPPTSAVVHEGKQKTPASTSKRGTASQKPRKRKKASASPEQQPVVASPNPKRDMVSLTPGSKHSAGFTLSTNFSSNALGSNLVPNTGQITSTPNYQITGSVDAGQRIIFSEQIRGAIEQSIGQTKVASLHSLEAVRHKEGIWSHLSTVSRNKIPAEVEEKLTSAAAAAEAAASVAKTAAEAAKMASEAALQAKMMAEEALGSSISSNSLQNHKSGEFDVNGNPSILLTSTPASSLKIKDNTHTAGSIISVAREAARKRVEEASAAAKRAENLDAILKAAEHAAEAVYKVGTIIGMGEPLPFNLSELLEAGPDGYWKSEHVRNKKAGAGNANPVKEILEAGVPADFSKSGKKRGRKPKSDQAIVNSEPSPSGKELQPDGVQSGRRIEDFPTMVSLNGNRDDTVPIDIIWNGIEKGSTVEVFSDEGGFGVAWFSATVVDIKEDSAFVSYDSRSEGTVPRKECVPLKQEGDKAPQIRLAHPATLSKTKTRKRRRETGGNCSWAVGDHIDAWVKDSWREGIITQNHEADGTKFVVQFSAAGGGGDSAVVDAWNLRPSLVWKDGQWTEWSRARERKSTSNKGDSPLEKRRRTGPLQASSNLPIGGEAVPTKDMSTDNGKKAEELRPLALSQRDMVFNVGQSVVDNKTDALAFKRPGLQKEGSKVVYGVPKHGKKKKFMEVSKHYVADRAEKITDGNASTRFAKHLMPPLPRPRENTSKVDYRGRRVGEMRSRGPKPSKPQNVSANSIPDKDPLPVPFPSSGVTQKNFAFAGSMTSTSNTEKPTVEKNNSAHGTGFRTEEPSGSEIQAASSIPTSKQNVTTTNRAKRRYVPTVDNLNRRTSEKTSSDSAEPQRTNSDSAEPRRSNRRIQPTSRLLEGLQSSLIISKVPGEKGPRSHNRSTTSRGRTHG